MTAFPQFDGVIVRPLAAREYAAASSDVTLPLLVEARRDRSVPFLKKLLQDHAAAMLDLADQYGAILLRGFAVEQDAEFEDAMSAIPAFSPMNGYFMSEPGRAVLEGTRHVFPTNSLYKTGGGFTPIGSFHCENFYSLDVPRLQTFYCRKPSWLGGETGLLDMVRAFEALSPETQRKFEERGVEATLFPVTAVAERYRITPDAVLAFCEQEGLPVREEGGEKFIEVTKPCVYVHPRTGRKSLIVHLATNDLPGRDLDRLLRARLEERYGAHHWALHRYLWKRPDLRFFLETRRWPRKFPQTPQPERPYRLSKEELPAYADALAQSVSVFHWQAGDILIIDNARTAHSGMPGMGPREIRVIMGNPIPLQYPLASGVWQPRAVEGYRTFHQRLEAIRN